jgi:hypothetical protein
MRQALRALGWATKVLWILIIVFAATAVYSALNFRMGFGEPQATFSDGIIVMSFPLIINNSGYYPVSDLNLTTSLIDNKGTLISTSTTFLPLINHNSNLEKAHNISLSLNDLNLSCFLFEDSNFTADLSITMKIARAFSLRVATDMAIPWGAPLYNFSFGEMTLQSNTTHYFGVIPLSFENHSSFLNVTGAIRFEVYNNRGELLGSGEKIVDVPSYSGYRDQIELVVDDPAKITANGQVYVSFETSMFSFGPMVVPYE